MNTAIRRNMMISNVINSIYLLFLVVMTVGVVVLIVACEGSAQGMMDQAMNVNGESYIAGYELLGNLAGAGTLSFLVVILYMMLIISAAYTILFLAANISGYIVSYKVKTKGCTPGTVKGVRATSVFKCIVSLLVIVPMGNAMISDSSTIVSALIAIVPQAVVLFLSIRTIGMLPSRRTGVEPFEPGQPD